jgi:hypothetical protein
VGSRFGADSQETAAERRSHLQVQVRNGNACLEWLPTAFPFAEGPRVSVRLPPAVSQQTFGSLKTAPVVRSHDPFAVDASRTAIARATAHPTHLAIDTGDNFLLRHEPPMIEHSEALDGRMNAPRVPHGASLKVTTIFVIHCRRSS